MFFHNDLRYIVGKRSTIILVTHEKMESMSPTLRFPNVDMENFS
jgi:hypothetical protein